MNNAILSTITIHLSFIDRLRILFNGTIIVYQKIFCEHPPGKVEAVVDTIFFHRRASRGETFQQKVSS